MEMLHVSVVFKLGSKIFSLQWHFKYLSKPEAQYKQLNSTVTQQRNMSPNFHAIDWPE